MRANKIRALVVVAVLVFVASVSMSADQRIIYTERLVGAGHPTLADTLNRLTLQQHNSDGTHVDNSITNAKLIDNTITSAKLLDNTVALSKINHSGTASSATYLRGDGAWTNPQVALSSYKNLLITTAADNQSVTITADRVVVIDTDFTPRVLSSVSLTVNLDTTGANGLASGSLAGNTGYFLYVIDNGTTTAGLASLSATSPALPGGYTRKALVGWCTTNNTATPFNVSEFTQIDDVYYWHTSKLVYSGTLSTTTLAIDLTAGGVLGYQAVPTIAREATVMVRSAAGWHLLNPVTFADSTAEDTATVYAISYHPGGSNGYLPSTHVPLVEAQTLYHQHTSTQATKTYITGFTLKR